MNCARRPPRLRPADAGAGQIASVYLREAQAYMLISMPTCTSTIFGVFQVIGGLPLVLAAVLTPTLNVRRVREQRKCGTRQSSSGGLIQQPIFHSWTRIISLSGKALRDTHIDRAPEAFAPSGSRPLFQQAQQRFPGAAVQLLRIQGPVFVRIGCVKASLHHGKIFIKRQRTVMIGIGSRQLLGTQPARQLALVERAIMIAIELREQV